MRVATDAKAIQLDAGWVESSRNPAPPALTHVGFAALKPSFSDRSPDGALRNPGAGSRTCIKWRRGWKRSLDRDKAIRAALKNARRGGVNVNAIPDDAVELLVEAREPDER